MKDPEIELKRRLHNLQTGQNLTYEEFCLYEIRNLYKADKVAAKEFKTTIGIERNVKNKIMRKGSPPHVRVILDLLDNLKLLLEDHPRMCG